MNTGSWVALYLPLFIIFFIILPQQRMEHKTMLKIRKRKGVVVMTNELIKKYIGKNCLISTGSFGTNVKGKIIDVNGNWLELATKKGTELINVEFIQIIKNINV